MAKQGRYAKKLGQRLRAALDRLNAAGRGQDGNAVEERWRSWWAARRPGERVEQRPDDAGAPAIGHAVRAAGYRQGAMRWLERRLNAACDRMRLSGRPKDARDCAARWHLWRAARRAMPGELYRRRCEEMVRRRQEKLGAKREHALNHREARLRMRRLRWWARILRSECAFAPADLAAAAAAVPVPTIDVRFAGDWRIPEVKHFSERHAQDVLPYRATCSLYGLSAEGRSREEAIGRLERLIHRHEAEGPAGDDQRTRPRLFPFPTPAEFVQPVPPQCRPRSPAA